MSLAALLSCTLLQTEERIVDRVEIGLPALLHRQKRDKSSADAVELAANVPIGDIEMTLHGGAERRESVWRCRKRRESRPTDRNVQMRRRGTQSPTHSFSTSHRTPEILDDRAG